jgi:hypothetical protein
MKLDYFEYSISSRYLPSLINGDDSGMTEDETRAFSGWFDVTDRRITHWEVIDYGDNFKRCDISGLLADCATVRGYFLEV